MKTRTLRPKYDTELAEAVFDEDLDELMADYLRLRRSSRASMIYALSRLNYVSTSLLARLSKPS